MEEVLAHNLENVAILQGMKVLAKGLRVDKSSVVQTALWSMPLSIALNEEYQVMKDTGDYTITVPRVAAFMTELSVMYLSLFLTSE